VLFVIACSTISVLDSRNFDPNRLKNRSMIFGSIALIYQGRKQRLGHSSQDDSWFSFTLKNIDTGEHFILVELPQDGRYYFALEPGQYTINEWTFNAEGTSVKCHSHDLYVHIPPQSFIYLGELVIKMESKGGVVYQVKDDFENASYFFFERFPGFFPQLKKNHFYIKSTEDYYFYIQ
jgi:hypothetical protein